MRLVADLERPDQRAGHFGGPHVANERVPSATNASMSKLRGFMSAPWGRLTAIRVVASYFTSELSTRQLHQPR
jgi:hypothetical protein